MEAQKIGPENPLNELSDTPSYFQAGRLQQFVPAWQDITDDPEVLDWVEHCHLEFIDDVSPVQEPDYKVIKFNATESATVDSEG